MMSSRGIIKDKLTESKVHSCWELRVMVKARSMVCAECGVSMVDVLE